MFYKKKLVLTFTVEALSVHKMPLNGLHLCVTKTLIIHLT